MVLKIQSILSVLTIVIAVLIGQARFENVTVSMPTSQAHSALGIDPETVNKATAFASRLLYPDMVKGRRKLFLPKGTLLTISPKITLPVFRNKPLGGGLNSDIQASWVFYMNFDKLGMTSDTHPWPFEMPPFYPFGSHMRPQTDADKPKDEKKEEKEDKPTSTNQNPKPFPNIVNQGQKYVQGLNNNYGGHFPSPQYWGQFPHYSRHPGMHHRRSRSVMSLPPPENIHGGERAVLLPSIENLMGNFGFEGRACLLRAICEIHEVPLGSNGFGLFGEILTLFFSISESQYAETHMPEYLRAEMDGRAGDCSFYSKNCTKSIFQLDAKRLNPIEVNDINV